MSQHAEHRGHLPCTVDPDMHSHALQRGSGDTCDLYLPTADGGSPPYYQQRFQYTCAGYKKEWMKFKRAVRGACADCEILNDFTTGRKQLYLFNMFMESGLDIYACADALVHRLSPIYNICSRHAEIVASYLYNLMLVVMVLIVPCTMLSSVSFIS